MMMQIEIGKGIGFNSAPNQIGTTMRTESNMPNLAFFLQFLNSRNQIAFWVVEAGLVIIFRIEPMDTKQIDVLQFETLQLGFNLFLVACRSHVEVNWTLGLNDEVFAFAKLFLKYHNQKIQQEEGPQQRCPEAAEGPRRLEGTRRWRGRVLVRQGDLQCARAPLK